MTTIPTINHITVDCTNPRKVAEFWAAVFSTEIADDWGEFLRLEPGQGNIQLAFAKVSDRTPGKNRIHLDLGSKDREAEVVRLQDLGATRVQDHELQGIRWTVMTDVEGNEFCIAE